MMIWCFSKPLPDPNVVYVFHFYEPHIFTHQGATWGAYYWQWLKGLHYPSSPENAAEVAKLVPEARDRMQVIRYGQDHWECRAHRGRDQSGSRLGEAARRAAGMQRVWSVSLFL